MSVIDVNDNPPIFNAATYNFEVFENLGPGTEVGVFQVTDQDFGDAASILFTLTGLGSERFSVETVNVIQMSVNGSQPPVVTNARLVTSRSLDREEVATYQFNLIAQDRSSMPLSATVSMTVNIVDINDNNPVFSSPSFAFNINEGTTNTIVTQFIVSQ